MYVSPAMFCSADCQWFVELAYHVCFAVSAWHCVFKFMIALFHGSGMPCFVQLVFRHCDGGMQVGVHGLHLDCAT